MSRSPSSWLNLSRAVGQALLELLGAELSALSGDLKLSGRRVAGGVVLLLVSLSALFWGIGALSQAAVEYLALSYPRWQANLLVVAGFVVIALLLAAIGWWRLRGAETPAAAFRRRLDDHLGWWDRRMADTGQEPVSGSGPEEGS